jgi:hypothetical protein
VRRLDHLGLQGRYGSGASDGERQEHPKTSDVSQVRRVFVGVAAQRWADRAGVSLERLVALCRWGGGQSAA